jgi:DNA processing protein
MLGVGTGGQAPSLAGPVRPSSDGHTPAPAPDSHRPSDAGATDPYRGERDAWTALASAHGLGPVGFAALLAEFGTGRAIMEVAAGPSGLERLMAARSVHVDRGDRTPIHASVARAIVSAVENADQIVSRVHTLGVRVVTVEEPAYPVRLASIAMPPHVLFVTGDPAALSRERAVAIVGTRRATTAGRTTAGRISSALVASDATIVSGLAFGIDGAAHEATVRAGGTTVAVVGGGHAVVAPTSHARLAAAIIAAGGAVVSELAPDVAPSRGTFPRRNRIISGLSDATVVVEAPARSGALITASWALEQGRPCYLVPGPLDAPSWAGCLAFLREWEHEAHLVAGIPQLIADLGFAEPIAGMRDAVAAATHQSLGKVEGAIAAQLVAGHVTVDELVAVTDLPVASVLTALVLLERRGLAVGVHGRYRPAGPLLGERVRIRPR